ncbi:hypothetical protein E4U21_001988 [Claviceps maximensis]|nr:hypothetical protein E4U21_001988 [Claviceps maximensis]
MCTYTTALAIHVDCTRNPKHKLEKLLYRRCKNKPKPEPYCDDATFDPSLPTFLHTERRGRCKICRDSGISVGTTIYEHYDLREP